MSAFFKENEIVKEPVKYVASKRYIGVDGKPIEWELRALTNDEIETLQKWCTKKVAGEGHAGPSDRIRSGTVLRRNLR